MAKRLDEIERAIKEGDDLTAEKALLTEIRFRETRLRSGREYHPPYLEYEKLAKIYRKRKAYDDEVGILKQLFKAKKHVGLPSGRFGERLRRAIALQAKSKGVDVAL